MTKYITKKHFYFILLTCTTLTFSQQFHLTIKGSNKIETNIIDSLGYPKNHSEIKQIINLQKTFQENLIKLGYLETEWLENFKTNDSCFTINYKLGDLTKNIKITTKYLNSEIKKILNLNEDTILSVKQTEIFIQEKLNILEKNGYAQAKIKLTNFTNHNKQLQADLKIDLNEIRKITNLTIKGYEKFPNGIKKVFLKKHQHKPYNKEIVEKIQKDFNSLPFAIQLKHPEVLLKKDSTNIFIYLKQKKSNSFDGILGFGNNEKEQKIQLNGYLDLTLFNNLNAGENFNLYWKNDGKKQSTFNIKLDLAYLFNSPIAMKTNLKIFKQDSIFQNSSFDLDLGYIINYNTKAYIGYKDIVSEAIPKAPNPHLKDLKTTFTTTSVEFKKNNANQTRFPEKLTITGKIGTGNRTTENTKTKQYFIQIQWQQILEINKKTYLHVKNDNYYLQSPDYYTNELFRFGGVQSIRGFNENSLQGNAFTGIFTEIRYLIASNLYLNSITDYAILQDKANHTKNQLYGLGFGFGLNNNSGLFNFSYTNGNTSNQKFKIGNSIIQISFKTQF